MDKGVSTLEKLRSDEELAAKFDDLCDFQVYPEDRAPDDASGRATWNIAGRAIARDGTGGEYVLLDDGSVAFNSSEGETGRIADSLADLFELLLNVSGWMAYLFVEPYEDPDLAARYIADRESAHEAEFNENAEDEGLDFTYQGLKSELLDTLGIQRCDNIKGLLDRFYQSAIREPQYVLTWTENGKTTCTSGCIIELNMRPALKNSLA